MCVSERERMISNSYKRKEENCATITFSFSSSGERTEKMVCADEKKIAAQIFWIMPCKCTDLIKLKSNELTKPTPS